jgi:hypothetical protein
VEGKPQVDSIAAGLYDIVIPLFWELQPLLVHMNTTTMEWLSKWTIVARAM